MIYRKAAILSAACVLVAIAVIYLVYQRRANPVTQDIIERYNVVVVVSDALRQDVVGCYGGSARTPNIDWLAENGTRFENAYSTSPWTSPSAVSMFTGNHATSYVYSKYGMTKRPAVAGGKDLYVPQIYVPHNEFMLAESLKQLGYSTAMRIENINAEIHNNLQGLDSIPIFKPSPQVADSIDAITGGELSESWDQSDAYWDAFYVLRYLMNVDPEENFFVTYWMLDPHAPYSPVDKFLSRIVVDESKLPVPKHFYWTRKYDRSLCEPPEQKFIKDLYLAEVESVDERVGFVLAMLKHKQLLEDTYVVFTSDHGEQFGEHGLYGHGGHGIGCHYYEGLVRVPFIIMGPGIPKGKTITKKVSLISLVPTLKDLLGVRYEEDMQGASLEPLLSGNDVNIDNLYFDDVQDHEQTDALLENSYKLIALKNGGFELYEIIADPKEEANFADRNPEMVSSMFRKILSRREENERRHLRNLVALGDSLYLMSDQEKRIILKKLKALGYVE